MNRGLTIELIDKRVAPIHQTTFCYDNGIGGYVEFLTAKVEPVHRTILIDGKVGRTKIECALRWTGADGERLLSFVNNVNTREGGGHVRGLKATLLSSLKTYISDHKIDAKESSAITWDDVKDGLTAVISVRLPEPVFEGQTKTKLGNAEVQGLVAKFISDRVLHWLEYEPAIAKLVVQKILNAKRERESAAKHREQNRRKQAGSGLLLANWLIALSRIPGQANSIWLKETQPAAALNRVATGSFRLCCPCGARFSMSKKCVVRKHLKTPKFRR